MAWMLRQYSDGERERHSMRGVVTGKMCASAAPRGGSRRPARGWSTASRSGSPITTCRSPARASWCGLRQLGSAAAEILVAAGARCVAVQDADGTIHDPKGIDVRRLVAYVPGNPQNLERSVRGFPDAEAISASKLLGLDADI